MSGHTPLSSLDGEGGRESGEEEEEEGEGERWLAKQFDTRLNAVLIKIHCVQTRWVTRALRPWVVLPPRPQASQT